MPVVMGLSNGTYQINVCLMLVAVGLDLHQTTGAAVLCSPVRLLQ